MRVLYISWDGILDPLGQSQILPYLTKLAVKRIKIYLLTLEKSNMLKNEIHEQLARQLSASGIDWHWFVFRKKRHIVGLGLSVLNAVFTAIKLCVRYKIKIVHARSYPSAVIAVLLKKLFGCRVIFDARGLWFDERFDGGLWPRIPLLVSASKALERWLFRNSDKVVVLTHKFKELVLNSGYANLAETNVKVIPTCVDTNIFYPRKAKKEFDFVYAGSIGARYLPNEMVKFFAEYRKRKPAAKMLFLLNDGAEHVQLLTKQYDVPENAVIFAKADYAEVPEWLGKARFGIIFLKQCVANVGSCPTKFAEYLSCGLPVIVSSGIGDCDEILMNHSLGVIAKNFSEKDYARAAEGILRLSNSKNFYIPARKVVEGTFSLQKGVEDYYKIYISLQKKA